MGCGSDKCLRAGRNCLYPIVERDKQDGLLSRDDSERDALARRLKLRSALSFVAEEPRPDGDDGGTGGVVGVAKAISPSPHLDNHSVEVVFATVGNQFFDLFCVEESRPESIPQSPRNSEALRQRVLRNRRKTPSLFEMVAIHRLLRRLP